MEADECESICDLYIQTKGLLCLGSVCFRDAVEDGYCEECNPNKSVVPATRKLHPKKKATKTSQRAVVAAPSRERKSKQCAERGCIKMALRGMTYCYLQMRGQAQADHAWRLQDVQGEGLWEYHCENGLLLQARQGA